MAWWDTLLDIGSVAEAGYKVGGAIADLDLFGFNTPPSLPPRSGVYGGVGASAAPSTTPVPLLATPSRTNTRVQATGGATVWNDDPFAVAARPGNGGGTGVMVPRGYRLVQRNGQLVYKRIRHMNPLNPRALLRAERRMGAFTTWVKRHFRIAASTPRRRKATRKGCYTRRRK